MIIKTFVGRLCYKLFTLLISALYAVTPYTGPATDAPIQPAAPDTVQLYFAALADTQISNYMLKRVRAFDATCEDLHNAAYPLDAVLIAGDVAENGLAIEYQYIYEKLSGLGCPYINAEGNHDIRLRIYQQSLARFSDFSNALNENDDFDSYHYSVVLNGYKFIVLGSDRTMFEESDLSDTQLAWLDTELAGENGHPTFVVLHQPLKETHGLPDTWGSPFDSAGSVGKQSDQINETLQKYDNVILITGHLHTGFGDYTYEEYGNIHMVNLPSLTVKNKDGGNNDSGIGCMVECYENEVVFRARNFSTGEWLPDYDWHIAVK